MTANRRKKLIKLRKGQLVILIAPTATGKTTFCKKNFNLEECKIISYDEIHKKNLSNNSKDISKAILDGVDEFYDKIKESLHQKNLTIVDSIFLDFDKRNIDFLRRNIFKEIKDLEIVGIVLLRNSDWSIRKKEKRNMNKLSEEQKEEIIKQYYKMVYNYVYGIYDQALNFVYMLENDEIDNVEIKFI